MTPLKLRLHPTSQFHHRADLAQYLLTIQRLFAAWEPLVTELDREGVVLDEVPQASDINAELLEVRKEGAQIMSVGILLPKGSNPSLQSFLHRLLGVESENLVLENLRVEHSP